MELTRLGKWFGKSVAGLVANLLLLTLWVDGLDLSPVVAIPINWALLSVLGYALADQWVFRDFDVPTDWRSHAKRYVSMQSVMGVSKLLNYGIYLTLLSVVDYRVAWVIGAGIVFGLTFLGNRTLWDWSEPA